MFIMLDSGSHFFSSHWQIFIPRRITWISRTASRLFWWHSIENINEFVWSFAELHLIHFFFESEVMGGTNPWKFEGLIFYSLINWRSMNCSDVLGLQGKLNFSLMWWTLVQGPGLLLIVFKTVTLGYFHVD